MTAPELKPCPFCGSHPYDDEETAKIFGKRTGHVFAIACRNCEISACGSPTMDGAFINWEIRADLAAVAAAN